jgi:hypothetical protein
MAPKFTSENDDRIIAMWYQGYLRPEIERETGTSAGHISKVIAEEKQRVGSGEVDALRRLAAAVKKGNYTPVDIMRGIRLQNACRSGSIDDEALIDVLPNLDAACKKNGIGLKDLPLKTEQQIAEMKVVESKKQTLLNEISQLDETHKNALIRAKVTEERLERYAKVTGILAKHGLPEDSGKAGKRTCKRKSCRL